MANPFIATPEVLAKINDLAKKGVNQENIARCIGISPATWFELKKRQPEIQDLIKSAKAHGEAEVVGYLWEILRNKDHKQHFAAICFYLKTQHQWREREESFARDELPKGLSFTKIDKEGKE